MAKRERADEAGEEQERSGAKRMRREGGEEAPGPASVSLEGGNGGVGQARPRRSPPAAHQPSPPAQPQAASSAPEPRASVAAADRDPTPRGEAAQRRSAARTSARPPTTAARWTRIATYGRRWGRCTR